MNELLSDDRLGALRDYYLAQEDGQGDYEDIFRHIDVITAEVVRLRRERLYLGPYFVRDMARIAGLSDDASMDEIARALRAIASKEGDR